MEIDFIQFIICLIIYCVFLYGILCLNDFLNDLRFFKRQFINSEIGDVYVYKYYDGGLLVKEFYEVVGKTKRCIKYKTLNDPSTHPKITSLYYPIFFYSTQKANNYDTLDKDNK